MVRRSKPSPQFSLTQRSAGLLLHPTSLPGPLGCGDLGEEAHKFVEFLAAAGQRWWQMLPIGPIGAGGSPYDSCSAFAGSPLLVSPQQLVRDRLLARAEVTGSARESPPGRASVEIAERSRMPLLRQAYQRFTGSVRRSAQPLRAFVEREREWLDDFALFRVLSDLHGGKPWTAWPRALRDREPRALARVRDEHYAGFELQRFVQFLFDRQWTLLREACRARGIGLIGDLPIFVGHNSADVWANRGLFQLDAGGKARFVTGCPPDSFSDTGQLWGHPQYDWAEHIRTNFAWWIARLRRMFDLFDAVRIDHFLGFNRVWSIRGGAKTAEHGTWVASPGYKFFDTVRADLGEVNIVAEDLGAVVPQAHKLRDHFGFPGMRILQNAFGAGARYDQPHNYARNCVAYTGTHDNDTVVGWFRRLTRDRATRARALSYLGSDGHAIHTDMIRALYASVANTVVVPIQDVLGLGNEARMNTPATTRGNWTWRLRPGALTPRHAAQLRSLAEMYERRHSEKSA